MKEVGHHRGTFNGAYHLGPIDRCTLCRPRWRWVLPAYYGAIWTVLMWLGRGGSRLLFCTTVVSGIIVVGVEIRRARRRQ